MTPAERMLIRRILRELRRKMAVIGGKQAYEAWEVNDAMKDIEDLVKAEEKTS